MSRSSNADHNIIFTGETLNEIDYIKATNRVKVSTMLSILRDVLPGKDYGITESESQAIGQLLSDAEARLFKSFKLTEK